MNANSKLVFVAAKKSVTINNHGFINNSLPKLMIDMINNLSLEKLLEFDYSDFSAFYIRATLFQKKYMLKYGAYL